MKHRHALLFSLALSTLNGCATRGAPSFALFGAFFPAWIICAIIGIVAAIAARAVLVATGLSDVLPFQLLVCTAIGTCVALLSWWIAFGSAS